MDQKSPTDAITHIDKDLSLLRSEWMKAKPDKKPQWYEMINVKLEERFGWMTRRDEISASS